MEQALVRQAGREIEGCCVVFWWKFWMSSRSSEVLSTTSDGITFFTTTLSIIVDNALISSSFCSFALQFPLTLFSIATLLLFLFLLSLLSAFGFCTSK
ncbi:hypothetical protein Lalb_Chr10g0103881 [Lupinus albus]|uniref:Transmembrane protein n=1 Tax=Lupinus albus TaxID=3870 RepID=A0A6A4PXJ8_LUPAL|nr:hypothetical protein Lalb_Chr10g0103881 [Lupinus albus]